MASARARRREALIAAGCRDFFVSTWAEAEALAACRKRSSLVVLHGVGPDDIEAALARRRARASTALEQVARWQESRRAAPAT